MHEVSFACKDAPFSVVEMSGSERLGEASSFELTLVSPEPVDPESVLGQPGALLFTGPFGERPVHGVVTRVTAVATAQTEPARRYRVTFASALRVLSLRRQTRVFQHLSVPDIVAEVMKSAGFSADRVATTLTAAHAPRAYLVQYAETDEAFVRRLCEDEGLYFHFEPQGDFDALALADDSTHAAEAADATLTLVDEARLEAPSPVAFACRSARRRRPGKVTLRDYDPAKPSLKLEGVAQAGKGTEKAVEIYRAPGRFKSPDEGAARATTRLQSVRAEARTFSFETSSVAVAPGLAVTLEASADYAGTARPEGKLFVVAVEHRFRRSPPEHVYRVTAIPADVPYRLPVITPWPHIAGLHSAKVTGAAGEEIHADASGHVKIRFPWDRAGPTDDESSLPVRVMQPNMPGSMLIPRVGWEVLVAFEDGDPDRPYVLGRTYNAAHLPPFPLPANKTITALSTPSSPGAGKRNSVHMDDGAGRQHLSWYAGFAKTTTTGNNMLTQTVGFEKTAVTGDQTWTIGGSETVSVKNALLIKVGSQSATVGGAQSVLIKAAGKTAVGSEAVLVGGALLEQVGNPVSGAKAFAEAAVLAGVGEIPVVGPFLSKGYSAVKAVKEGYEKGGMSGALTAAGQQATSLVADQIPAGDAIVAGADAMGLTPWSDKAQAKKGAQEAGGGTGGPGAAAAGAAAAAPGFRKTIVDGVMAEAIGAAHSVTTPGSVKWTTLGASSFAVGGSHSTRAVKISRLTGGISSDKAASMSITAATAIGRTIKGALKTTIDGSLSSEAGGPHHVKAGGNLTIKVGGSLDAEGGAVVFIVGSSIVAAHGGGVLLKASTVTINGKATQSGKATNQ